jgi:rsbT antagonist protein RsbS
MGTVALEEPHPGRLLTSHQSSCGVREGSLESLRIPILKIGDVLIASIQVALHDSSAVQFKEDLLNKIYETKARGLIVDLTAVEVVDSFIGRLISDIASMAGLMGTRVVITGLQPAVAITLVELGLELPQVLTALNLEKGLAMLRRQVGESDDGSA